MIGETLGNYEITAEIGAGGMGVVYQARDMRLGRQVALKVLPASALTDSDAQQRFLREARAASALNHPGICTIHDIGEHLGRHFLVMELLEGQTLRQRLGAGPLPLDEALDYGCQLCDALQAAHERGVLHRDIKPENIFVTFGGSVKVLDFGLAKALHGEDPAGRGDDVTVALGSGGHLTTPGMALGTVAYMSPEQARGEEVDARTDLFSLGVVLYEMMTGQQAFRGSTPAVVFDAMLNRPPDPVSRFLPSLPTGLERVLSRLLAKDRRDRHASAAELRSDLERAGEPLADRVGPSSIAVLPFVNMSADAENEYFTDGMAEEVINALGKIEALRVASRTSSFTFKGKQQDIREIARVLNVDTILEGSVRKAGNRLRISAQLVKADDGYHLWSDRFDRELEDVFAVQDEIARSIADALRVVLSPREKEAIQKVPTQNLEAYDLYLRARAHIRRLGESDLRAATALFRRATELDPDFALAWVGMAECATWATQWFDKSPENLQRAEVASQRALAIDPDLAEGHVARGLAATLRDDHTLALEAYEEAIRLDPRLFDAYYFAARSHMPQGRLEEAARCFLKAAEVRPEDFQALCLAVTCFQGLERPEQAIRTARRALEVIEQHMRLHPEDVRAVYLGAGCHSTLGHREKALEEAERALNMVPNDTSVRYNVACIYVNAGRQAEALRLLEANVDDNWGNRDWIENDPDWAVVRDDPRFQALLHRMSAQESDADGGS